VIHLCDTIIASVPAFEYCLIIDISSITPTTKKVIERLKDTFDRRRCPGNKSGEHLFIWNFEKLEVKIYRAKRCS
jgi:hypothetical protein